MAEEQGRPAGPAARDVAEARAVVEASRQRIASTLDELETRVVEQKESLQDRLDVARPLRDYVSARPLAAVGMAVAAGVVFGLLTGGSRSDAEDGDELSSKDRKALKQWRRERRKRLLGAAEDELPSFDPPPSRVGRLFRDMMHELVGAGSALLVSSLVDRVNTGGEE